MDQKSRTDIWLLRSGNLMVIDKILGIIKTKLVGSDGQDISVTNHKLDINTTDLSKESTQQDVLTEIQKKTSPSDIQPVELIPLFKQLIQSIVYPPWLDRSANAIRNQVQSGTITTVTTVTTVTGMTNIDSYQGKLLIINQNISAWANACRSRIS